MTTTKIFKSYQEFLEREDKAINGVSPGFARENPGYQEDNGTNEGCWNCKDCRGCRRCTSCLECVDCDDCLTCFKCEWCLNCVSCAGCKSCGECMGCVNCSAIISKVNCKDDNLKTTSGVTTMTKIYEPSLPFRWLMYLLTTVFVLCIIFMTGCSSRDTKETLVPPSEVAEAEWSCSTLSLQSYERVTRDERLRIVCKGE